MESSDALLGQKPLMIIAYREDAEHEQTRKIFRKKKSTTKFTLKLTTVSGAIFRKLTVKTAKISRKVSFAFSARYIRAMHGIVFYRLSQPLKVAQV